MNIEVKILRNEHGKPAGKLADAEIHFIGGELDGTQAGWLRRLGAARRHRPKRHVPGAPVHRPRRSAQLRVAPGDQRSHCTEQGARAAVARIRRTDARVRQSSVVAGCRSAVPSFVAAPGAVRAENPASAEWRSSWRSRFIGQRCKIGRIVHASVRQRNTDGHRGRGTPGRVPVHRTLLAD